MAQMRNNWRYRCLDWMLYLGFCGVMIAVIVALASLFVPIRDLGLWPLLLLAAWLVYHKLRSPDPLQTHDRP